MVKDIKRESVRGRQMNIWQKLKRYWNRYELDAVYKSNNKVYIGIVDLWFKEVSVCKVNIEDVPEFIEKLINTGEGVSLDFKYSLGILSYHLYIPSFLVKPLAAKLLELVDTTPIDLDTLNQLLR